MTGPTETLAHNLQDCKA